MILKMDILPAAVLMVAAHFSPGYGQVMPPTILEVDVENWVNYIEDSSDLSKFATNPNVTTAVPPKNFSFRLGIADIVAVNGQPAKGILTGNIRNVTLTTTPNAGQAIADTARGGVVAYSFDILKSDGTPVGTISCYGPSNGSPPPGAPLSVIQSNFAIMGGTGAFLGARGQVGAALSVVARPASITEDPANRRRNGGNRTTFVLQVIPMYVPQIATTAIGPAVAHSSDFTLVSASKPAAAGEILSLFASGLGPTTPGVNPGKPFPATPLVAVNSPVAVTVNGKPAEVTAADGLPGAVDGYQVNFRVPQDTAAGVVSIQVSSAWIAGAGVNIVVQ
jgi:uncharacterized protein (TIGR03437 family)